MSIPVTIVLILGSVGHGAHHVSMAIPGTIVLILGSVGHGAHHVFVEIMCGGI